jgi:hypothetical protein
MMSLSWSNEGLEDAVPSRKSVADGLKIIGLLKNLFLQLDK